MNEFQRLFDESLTPACLGELTSPVLHRCLAWPSLQSHLFGAKGVGSQGDGSCQILCKSEQSQAEVERIIREELGMVPMTMVIRG